MGGYVPGNLRWATRAEQAHNQRDNVVRHPDDDAPVDEWRAFLKDLTFEDCEAFGRCECGQRLAGHPDPAPMKPLGDRYEQIPASLRSAARERPAQEINAADRAGFEEHRKR